MQSRIGASALRNHHFAVVGEKPVRLDTGDVVVFPHGDAHVISSAPDVRPERQDPDWVFATANDPKPIPISLMGADSVIGDMSAEGAQTVLVC